MKRRMGAVDSLAERDAGAMDGHQKSFLDMWSRRGTASILIERCRGEGGPSVLSPRVQRDGRR